MALIETVNLLAAARSEIETERKRHMEVMRHWQNEELRLQTIINQTEAGLDLAKISLAETVMYAGDYSRAGQDRDGARQDAIKWFAGRQTTTDLQHEYIGTKSYDRWYGQRCDCGYGMGPRHGSIIFEIGLRHDVRKRELTPEEREAAVYYLINLERIQSARAKAAT